MEKLKNKTLNEIETILTDEVLMVDDTSYSPYDARCRMSEKLEKFLNIKNSNNREGRHYFEFYFEPYYYVFSLLTEKKGEVYKPKGIKFKGMSVSTESGSCYNFENISCSFEYDEENNRFILLPYEEGSNKIDENSWLFYSEFEIKDKKTPIINFMDKKFVKESLYNNLKPDHLDIGFLYYRFKEYGKTVPKEDLFSLYKDFLFEYHLKNSHLSKFLS